MGPGGGDRGSAGSTRIVGSDAAVEASGRRAVRVAFQPWADGTSCHLPVHAGWADRVADNLPQATRQRASRGGSGEANRWVVRRAVSVRRGRWRTTPAG